jgi:OmcA/MtrC family decaheme c-type cytochrome
MHLVKSRPRLFAFVALFVLASAFVAAQIIDAPVQVFNSLDKAFYLTAQDAQWTRPGLQLTIQNIAINADRTVQVTFRITDANGIAIDRLGIYTPGTVSTSFILAYLPKTATQYVAYTTRVVTSPITQVTATQAGTDSGGTYTDLGDGTYTYKFKTVLPSGYDTTATHTVGIYATRNLTSYGLSLYVANATKNIVPNGSAVTQIREVVNTPACNACHDPLAAHGTTGRRDVAICILCHQPQTVDPDTGNTVDMKIMTHKIHMGSALPSVKAGKKYIIIGNAQSVNDYSTVEFPMDIRNCENCHKNSAQVDNWWANPTAATCGSCHDDVNFQTGANHEGGPQPSDKYCSYCHWEKGDWEYDATVRGAHTVPYKSTQLRYPKIQIVSVSNLGPGLKPVVKFKLSDKNGPIKPTDLNRLTLRFAGPTDDYRWNGSETANTAAAVVGSDGVITYSFATFALPADAKGSVALETEGYFNATLNPGTVKAVSQRDVMDSTVQFFPISGTTATPRRTIVQDGSCDKCHDKLWFHGGNRNNASVCGVCHNPTLTDSRPASKGA